MAPHLDPSGNPTFPSLPIVTPGPARRPASERYGTLFYLGLTGLLAVVCLLGWFAWGAWSLRSVWSRIYILHDPGRGEAERVQAAFELSRDRGVGQAQLQEIALRRPLPPLARYVVAEALTAEVVRSDPRGYGLAVARSEGWPDWLRLLLARPMACAATLGRPVARQALQELSQRPDPALALWARYALAADRGGDRESESILRRAAAADGPERGLAIHLVAALDARRLSDRFAGLDAATLWIRSGHPAAAEVWSGWEVRGDRLLRRPAAGR
jgi:hypothetical protein